MLSIFSLYFSEYFFVLIVLYSIHVKQTDFELKNFAEVTAEKLQEFIPNLLSKLFIEALIYGNVTKQVRKGMGGVLVQIYAI